MSPKTLKSKIKEMEALKAKLAAAEAELSDARESVIEKVEDLFDETLVGELSAMEITRLSVSVLDGEAKVSLGGSATKRKGGGKASNVEIPEEGVERTYKGETFKLVKAGEELEVSKDGELVGVFTSLTGAALGITGQSKGINGPRWWNLK